MQNYDVIVVGAGIVGAMTARELSRCELSILWIDKECDVGMGASSANSAILHAGYDPEPGSLKAEMNARGNKLWDEFAPELGIAFKRTGSYVVAVGEEQLPLLAPLYERGVQNGIPGLRILKRDEFLQKEPLINPRVSGALWTPSAGVIDPFGAVVAAAENAVANGVTLLLETEFYDFIIEGGDVKGVKTSCGDFACKWVVNAAGLYSDEMLYKTGDREDFKITSRRGEYLIFDANKVFLNNVLFPLPTAKGKGTLVTTTTHGNVMIGPNANVVGTKDDDSTTAAGLDEVLESAKHLVPSLSKRDVIAQFAGIRATGSAGHDFVIELSAKVRGVVHIAGIESPGFVSAPAIAKRVVELMTEAGAKFTPKASFNPVRKAPPNFRHLSHKERGELVAQNPAYGRIVCRCEEVTEGEIIAAIRSPIPAKTYDAIKRRTWLGTGRCQGGFDYPRVMEILAEELGEPMTAVTKRGAGSEFLVRGTKDV